MKTVPEVESVEYLYRGYCEKCKRGRWHGVEGVILNNGFNMDFKATCHSCKTTGNHTFSQAISENPERRQQIKVTLPMRHAENPQL